MSKEGKKYLKIAACIAAIVLWTGWCFLVPYPGELWTEILHKFDHEQYVWVTEPEKQALVENRLKGHSQGGMYQGSEDQIEVGFLYAYTHGAAEGVYYYRFRNPGKIPICVSSKILPPLIGASKLHLAPGEVKYLAVMSGASPKQSCANFHLWENCAFIHSTFANGACMIVPGPK